MTINVIATDSFVVALTQEAIVMTIMALDIVIASHLSTITNAKTTMLMNVTMTFIIVLAQDLGLENNVIKIMAVVMIIKIHGAALGTIALLPL